jgi:GTP-binding protein
MMKKKTHSRRRVAGKRKARVPFAGDAVLPRAEEIAALPVVALVGRPNTGKSTLFNRLTHSRRALVAATPGVTRDRNVGVAEHGECRFLLFDTGGFEVDETEELGMAVQTQAVLAAEQADAVIVVVDGRAGLNAHDTHLMERVRPLAKPTFVAVNKIDTLRQEDLSADFYALGTERLYDISAEHGINVGDLIDDVVAVLPRRAEAQGEGEAPTAVAIIGRPNVGKSSLLNRLVGYERAIVTNIPGTTRDPLDTPVSHDGKQYLLVDTAGIRRRQRVHQHLERACVVRAFRAVERAEIAVLVVDGVEGMTEQDARVAGYAWERGRALLLLVNKWDAVPQGERDTKRFSAEIDRRYPSLDVVPRIFISALTGRSVHRIWGAIDRLRESHRLRVPTPVMNDFLRDAVRQQDPPLFKGRRPRLMYATQVATAPPTIKIFGSPADRIAAAYQRYLVNQLRSAFGFEGTPVRLIFRAREPREDSGRRPGARRSGR